MRSGPFAPDTVFMRARNAVGHAGEFDLVVAMTHDHGLIPVKYLGVEQGVNVTLGLPFVRTSPDHGTAFDIAGRGVGRPGQPGRGDRLGAARAAGASASAVAGAVPARAPAAAPRARAVARSSRYALSKARRRPLSHRRTQHALRERDRRACGACRA